MTTSTRTTPSNDDKLLEQQQKYFMKQQFDNNQQMIDDDDDFTTDPLRDPIISLHTLTTTTVRNGNTTSRRRRVPPTAPPPISQPSSFGSNFKVSLEIPLQYTPSSRQHYHNADDDGDVSKMNGDESSNATYSSRSRIDNSNSLSIRQMSRLSLNTSFLVFAPPKQRQQQQQQRLYSNDKNKTLTFLPSSTMLPEITCHMSAITAMRGRTGYATGSTNIQYRFHHLRSSVNNSKKSNSRNYIDAAKQSNSSNNIIKHWTTTFHTGFGIQQEYNLSSASISNETNIALSPMSNSTTTMPQQPQQPTLRMGVCTNLSHHESSSSSLMINLTQQPKQRSKASLSNLLFIPTITLSHQQQIQFRSYKDNNTNNDASTATSTSPIPYVYNIRSQCSAFMNEPMTVLSSFQTTVPSIHTSLSLSPVTKPTAKDMTNNSSVTERKLLHHWTVNVGLNKSKDAILSPTIGCSIILAIPHTIQSVWSKIRTSKTSTTIKTTASKNIASHPNNKLLDCSIQWKSGHGFQLNGWWIHKATISSSVPKKQKTQHQSYQPDTKRQIGIGVLLSPQSKTLSSKSNNGSSALSGPYGLLQWILTWKEGDFTIRIPILIASTVESSMRSILFHQGFQLFYLSFVSLIIQDVICQFVLPKVPENETIDDAATNESHRLQIIKIRQEAIRQQSFMERQAKIRTALERERNGLVIHRAIMYIHYVGNDDKSDNNEKKQSNMNVSDMIQNLNEMDKLDVTIPFQFWLNTSDESKLLLYGKRSSMLGFYNLVSSKQKLQPLEQTQEHVAIHRIWVLYDYNGQSYEVVFDDNDNIEAVIELPNIQQSKRIS